MSTYKLRKQVILYSHRLDTRGFVANHDGNITARLTTDDRFLATPTARGKFELKETDLIVVDTSGKTKSGGVKIFGEWSLHAALYKAWPEITAIVHAHPPHASSLGLAGSGLPVDFWPEGVVTLGRQVPCVENDATALGAVARRASACLVQGNGVFAWGSSIEQAYLRLELVEHLTQIYTLARAGGTYRNLPAATVSGLLEKRKKAGLFSPEEV